MWEIGISARLMGMSTRKQLRLRGRLEVILQGHKVRTERMELMERPGFLAQELLRVVLARTGISI